VPIEEREDALRAVREPRARELAAALARALRGDVRADDYTRHLFAADASMYARRPLAVAFPRDADDVAAAIALAGRFEVPVVTRGGGTSLAGQTIGNGLVLDTSRHMNAIGEIDADTRRVNVGPGVVQEDLNLAAEPYGLGFGPDTSTANRATVGGMIGNNSSGSHSIVYGTTVDHVHELDVVLSDGSRAHFEPVEDPAPRAQPPTLEGAIYRGLPEILKEHREAIASDYPPHWRAAGGYRLHRLTNPPFDLARFVVGSEGSLVAVTEATVGLIELPKAKKFTVGHFNSVAEAIAATDDALALDAAAIELIDRNILELSRSKLEFRRLADTLEGDPEALLFVTFFGDTPEEAGAQLDKLEAAWRRGGHGYHHLRADTPAEQDALTTVRKSGLGMLMAASRGAKRPLAFVEDTAVPPEHLNDYVARFKEVLDGHGLTAGFYGHCSVGCLHIRPYIDLTARGGIETMQAVADEIAALVTEFGGVNSSEHGDGLARSAFNRRLFGDELYAAMQKVKRLFDPENRLNPGVIVDAPPMTDNLRDPALPPAGPLQTHFRFPEGGMRAAADRCVRIGACRKTNNGGMCPSYMATREEEHATRGRANALVNALSQPDPKAALGDERLHQILDLCLECKACKSECPLSVDMASLKSEFLSHYHAAHGVPLRSRVFGSIRALNRLGAATAPLSNLPGRPLKRLLGIALQRPLPRFRRDTLVRWHEEKPGTRGDVVFLADSFTTYTEPAVGRAAIELLEAAGHRVRLESAGCCGRAAISKGLLGKARAQAAALVERLAPAAEAGVPIVGCEPSCLLTLREEHLQLLDDPRARAVAAQARLVEELLVEAIDDGALRLDPSTPPRRIVFHGHCHQKALAGTAATVALLERIPGAEVSALDAGCCGMAGSFGFEAEHYELSMRIGELRLFPAVRAADAALVAATGVSCRQQIAHGTGREALHPVQIVRAAMAG
jgi:FAD/FMN-containing dehydrogenase/Fe-S oxidoreductase